ncbi:MAG: hypothetical protein R3C60_04990 [Parvularculaceae bacterium]
MGSLIRLIFGIPGAAVVTALLFLAMAYMIKQNAQLDEERASVNIQITQQLQDSNLNNANKEFKRPTLDTPPPPPPATQDPTNRPSLNGVRAEVPQINANLNVGTVLTTAMRSRSYAFASLSRRAAWRAVEESVVIEVDVTPGDDEGYSRRQFNDSCCLNYSGDAFRRRR